ncbi:MAG: hypothetical protein KC502_21525 [Myxococcales bacterium]|nr:hypothetical protein [Myxococcales bacterium]
MLIPRTLRAARRHLTRSRRASVRTSGIWVLTCMVGFGWLAGGCSDDFSPPSLIETVRVLGVRATPPFLPTTASEVTTVEAKVVGVTPGEPLCHAWGLCLLTSQQKGAFTCLDPALQLNLGTTPTVEIRFDQVMKLALQAKDYLEAKGLSDPRGSTRGASSEPPPSQPVKLMFGIGERASFAGGCPSDLTAFLKTGCEDRERCIIGSKTLRAFTSGLERHRNPTLTGLKINGKASASGAVVAVPAGSLKLTPSWSADSIEPRPDDGGPKTEQLLMSWFSTAGEYDKQRSFDDIPDNELSLKTSDGEVTIWVVVRDGAGGVDWVERRVQVK